MKVRYIAVVLLVLVMVLALSAACTPQEDMGKDKYISKADYYFSFDDEGVITESVHDRRYAVNYVFADAKYASDKSVPSAKGVRGKSMLFDGYSTYSDTAVVGFDDMLTVSVWVAPRVYDTRFDRKLLGIVSCLDENGGFELGMYNYGSWSFRVKTNKGTFQIWSEEQIVDLYRWNYLTAVFDGSQRKMYLYKNGQQVAQSNVLGDKLLASRSKLRIGAIVEAGTKNDVFTTNVFSGLIDELEIYSSALSDKTISDTYGELSKDLTLDVYKDLWLKSDILADDRYAPQYHMRTSQNWQNETYGFFYYNGLYHAFCQQNALAPYYTDGQRWGHFVSVDLVHWEELVPALIPENNAIDCSMVFSGGATLDKHGDPVLFYTGVNYSDPTHVNMITSARPADKSDMYLTEWNKSGKIEVEQGSLSNRSNFRDPFIYVEDGVYYMLIGATENSTENGAIYCYKCTDDALSDWKYVGLTYSGDKSTYPYLGNCYELPNLFKLTNADKTITKYMLMFSPINGTNNGVYYLLGSFDKATGKFVPDRDEPYRYDLGPVSQVLCPSGFYDAHTGRNLLITMSRTGMDSQEMHDSGWCTVMTLIKEISLDDNGMPIFRPIEEYDSLEKDVLLDVTGAYGTSQINALASSVKGDMLKIEVEARLDDDARLDIYVKYDADGAERVDVSFDKSTSMLHIDTSKSSIAMRNNGSGGGRVEVSGDIVKFTVYVDRAMVEAYLNDKNQVTAFGYNSSQSADGLMFYSNKSTTQIVSLKVYSLSSSHGNDVDAYWN